MSETNQKLLDQREMKGISKGILVYCCFLAVLVIITIDHNDINGFRLQQHYKRMFIRQEDRYHDLSKKVRSSNCQISYRLKNNNLYERN